MKISSWIESFQDPEDEPERIDSGILGLVRELNSRGLKTTDSCEGGGEGTHFKNAYIAFNDVDVEGRLSEIRKVVRSFTDTPFRIVHGYYAEYSGFIDYDAGMYSVVFKGRYIPR